MNTNNLSREQQEILGKGRKIAEEIGLSMTDIKLLELLQYLSPLWYLFEKDILPLLKDVLEMLSQTPITTQTTDDKARNFLLVENYRQKMLKKLRENPQYFTKKFDYGEVTTKDAERWINKLSFENPIHVLYAQKDAEDELLSKRWQVQKNALYKLLNQQNSLLKKAKDCRGTPMHEQIMQKVNKNAKKREKIISEMELDDLYFSDLYHTQ